jgi:hypothetical protein
VGGENVCKGGSVAEHEHVASFIINAREGGTERWRYAVHRVANVAGGSA